MNCEHSRSLSSTSSRADGAFSQRLSVAGSRARRQFLIGDDLQQGIVAQTIGVVGIFVSGDDLIECAVAAASAHRAAHVFLTRIVELRGQFAGQMMALIEGAQGQQTGIAGDLAARKIGADGLMTVKEKVSCGKTLCIKRWMLRKECRVPKPRCSSFLLEHPFFLLETS